MSSPPVFVGIAKLARQGALLEAKARVEYTELPTRRFFNRCSSERMPFDWTLNPYRGCEFGCLYCYARYTHEFMEFRDSKAFETKIFAKKFDAAAFRSELRRINPREPIAIGTATDPYQPAERRFRVTQRMLQVFARAGSHCLDVITKSGLIARDVELLAEVGRRNSLSVNITVTTVDPVLARQLEPMAPHPKPRLRALRILADAGIATGVYASPVLPGLNDSMASLRDVAHAARDSGARAFGASPLFLQPCAQQVLLPFLDQNYPRLARAYRERFSRSAFLRGTFVDTLKERVHLLRTETGLLSHARNWAPNEADPQLNLFGDELGIRSPSKSMLSVHY